MEKQKSDGKREPQKWGDEEVEGKSWRRQSGPPLSPGTLSSIVLQI